MPPPAGESRVVGTGRDRRSRRRSGRERSVPAPDLPWPIRHLPAFGGTGSRGAEQCGAWRDLVPGAGERGKSSTPRIESVRRPDFFLRTVRMRGGSHGRKRSETSVRFSQSRRMILRL